VRYHGRAMRVMGAAALGFVDIETLSDSSLLLCAPAASLTPLFWVNDVACDLEVLTTCVPNLFVNFF